jgi:hypothetical protein
MIVAAASGSKNRARAKDFGEIHRRLDLSQCRLPAFGARAQSADGGCRGLPVPDEHVDSIGDHLFAELELLQNIVEGVAHGEPQSESRVEKVRISLVNTKATRAGEKMSANSDKSTRAYRREAATYA